MSRVPSSERFGSTELRIQSAEIGNQGKKEGAHEAGNEILDRVYSMVIFEEEYS
jgi:hypothetical protein